MGSREEKQLSVLFVNLPETKLLDVYKTSLVRFVREFSHVRLGILDLVGDASLKALLTTNNIKSRIDWRPKSELDPDKINGKQVRWLRKWMNDNAFSIALYGELDIETHLIRVVIGIGENLQLSHVVLPAINDYPFLCKTCMV